MSHLSHRAMVLSIILAPCLAFFESYPILHGKYVLYGTYLWLFPSTYAFGTSLGSLIIYMVLNYILDSMDSRNRYVIPRDDPPDVEASGGQQVVNLDHPHTVEKGNKPTPPSTMVKILIYAILLFRSGAAFGFILGVVFMGMFDAIHIVISFFITWFALWLYLIQFYSKPVILPRSLESKPFVSRCFSKLLYKLKLVIERHRTAVIVTGLVSFTICLVVALITDGGCFALFNPMEGGYIMARAHGAMLATISTTFSRSLLPKPCPPGKGPCHVYLTLPRDASTSVFINAHFPPSIDATTILYNSTTGSILQATASVFPVPELESNGARDIHTTLLEGLRSDTIYSFRIQWSEGGVTHTTDLKWFRTIANDSQNVTFVIGGDAGANEIVDAINSQAASQSPHFAVLAGDLAYDNALFTCYRCWDGFLTLWETRMVTPDGLMIPIIAPVGNHDVGSNDFSGARQDLNHPALFFQYFPQHASTTGKVPAPAERLPYFYHLISNHTVIISLDSAHILPLHGEQDTFLEAILTDPVVTSRNLKIVTYHVPVYSSGGHWDDSTFSREARQYWVPLIDKYGVAVVFENHWHSLKRTIPMTSSEADPTYGTVYFGDGNWGVPASDVPLPEEVEDHIGGKLAFTSISHHFWKVEVGFNGTSASFSAIDGDGNVLDAARWFKGPNGTNIWT